MWAVPLAGGGSVPTRLLVRVRTMLGLGSLRMRGGLLPARSFFFADFLDFAGAEFAFFKFFFGFFACAFFGFGFAFFAFFFGCEFFFEGERRPGWSRLSRMGCAGEKQAREHEEDYENRKPE
jgi:hypothetical protein